MVELSIIVLVVLACAAWQRWNYIRIRRLMTAGWTAHWKGPEWVDDYATCYYNAPDEPNVGRQLTSAYRRYAILKRNKTLNVPERKEYQLGDFAKD